jgi:hypothetical protein
MKPTPTMAKEPDQLAYLRVEEAREGQILVGFTFWEILPRALLCFALYETTHQQLERLVSQQMQPTRSTRTVMRLVPSGPTRDWP